jgi:hypothetical protein
MVYNPLVPYLVNQIVLGSLTYQQVITKKPELKSQIDQYITEKGLDDVIDKTK